MYRSVKIFILLPPLCRWDISLQMSPILIFSHLKTTFNTDLKHPHIHPSIKQQSLTLPEQCLKANRSSSSVILPPCYSPVKHCGHSNSGLYFTNLHGCVQPSKCHQCHFPWLHCGCDSWMAHSQSWSVNTKHAASSHQGCRGGRAWNQAEWERERYMLHQI